MAVNRRQKGNRGEASVANLIAKWTRKKFGRADTNNYKHERNQYNSRGDVVCMVEGHYFPFCTEVKNYKDINFEHLLYLDSAIILDFWKQVTTDAELCGKCPLLFMRYNRLPKDFWFVVIPLKIYYPFFSKVLKRPRTLIYEKEGFIILSSKDFFSIDYKTIRKPIKLAYKSK